MGPWPKSIGAITLFVDDLEAAKSFYQQVFGFEVMFTDDNSAVFDFGNTVINLLATTAAPELIDPAAVAEQSAGSRLQLTIDVDDVDATCADLATRGVALLNGPMDRPWGIRTASFVDPGGHIWEIACAKPPVERRARVGKRVMARVAPTSETELLKSYLDAQRQHVLGILEGLDDEELRRPVLPSEWSCLSLVQHLALDVERFWFQAVVAGDATVVAELSGNSDNAWDIGPDASATSVLDVYRLDVERADSVIDATPLDAPPAWWPADLFGDWRIDSLRQIILHVIAETACHAGHLDAARELIDGRQWLVLTGDRG